MIYAETFPGWRNFAALVTCLTLLVGSGEVTADSWPQWGGRTRDFCVTEEVLDSDWATAEPRELWRRQLGEGYAGIAADGDELYVMYRLDDHEHAAALNASTGNTIWTHRYPAPFHGETDLSPGSGPHATPSISGDLVFTAGVTGVFHALDRHTGDVVWQHRLIDDWNGTLNFRGYSPSPLIYKKTILVNVGGVGQAVIAFDQRTGEVRWKSQDYRISHVSPRLIQVGGQTQYVSIAENYIFSLNANDGSRLWEFEHKIEGGNICSMPAWDGKQNLFFSAAYGRGSRVLELCNEGGSTTVRQRWHHSKLRVHHSNIILKDGMAVASSGDFGTIVFSAADLLTGKVLWQTREIGRASQLSLGNRHLVLEETGRLMLVTVTREGVTIDGSIQLPVGQYWTPPTLVDGMLYVRNREQIMAYQLRK